MSEALISRLDRDEARAPAPPEVLPCTLAVTGSIHRELKKVKFPKFSGAPDGAATEAWLENMAMCFALHDYTSNIKVCMAVKGYLYFDIIFVKIFEYEKLLIKGWLVDKVMIFFIGL